MLRAMVRRSHWPAVWRLPTPRAAPPRISCISPGVRAVWKLGISATPPEAAPYITGEYLMNTQRLKEFLGADYENMMRYTVEEAFEDSFLRRCCSRVTLEN